MEPQSHYPGCAHCFSLGSVLVVWWVVMCTVARRAGPWRHATNPPCTPAPSFTCSYLAHRAGTPMTAARGSHGRGVLFPPPFTGFSPSLEWRTLTESPEHIPLGPKPASEQAHHEEAPSDREEPTRRSMASSSPTTGLGTGGGFNPRPRHSKEWPAGLFRRWRGRAGIPGVSGRLGLPGKTIFFGRGQFFFFRA